MALCPNCKAPLDLHATECANCEAVFGQSAEWRPLPESAEEHQQLSSLPIPQAAAQTGGLGPAAVFLFIVTAILVTGPWFSVLLALAVDKLGLAKATPDTIWGLFLWGPLLSLATWPAAIVTGIVGVIAAGLHQRQFRDKP